MNWLSRLFSKKTASSPPWTFPHRIEGLSDTLALTVFEHELATQERPIPCWTFVTDGLVGRGQKELALTIARGHGEHPEEIARAVSNFAVEVHRMAGQGRLVDVGDITMFGGLGPAGTRGFAYVAPEAMPGVEVPLSALAAIPLMGDEARLARGLGPARVLARLARHYRYYPCPPWWERGRPAFAAAPGDESSLLAQMRRAHVRGVSARMERGNVRLSVHPGAREALQRTLAEVPTNTVFAILTAPDIEADGTFVWRPGSDQLEAATPQGSRAERLSLVFVAFAMGVDQIGGRVVEDGAALMFTTQAWEALGAAIAGGEPLTLAPTVGTVGVELHWMPTRYVSQVDGRAYDASGSWTTHHPPPAESAPPPPVLDRIV